MESSKHLSPTPTELIDWLAGENLLDLDWDFPEDGNLAEAGMDAEVVTQIVLAVEEEYGVELTKDKIHIATATPATLAELISSLRA